MNDNPTNIDGKYLTFHLGNEEYGVSITNVKEIIGMMEITEVPQIPPFMKGVINLRDHVIPVIDLRLKFAMSEASYTSKTCIVVVELHDENGAGNVSTMGVIVDAVSDVAAITDKQVEQAPMLANDEGDSSIILGIAKLASGVKILLDVNKALTSSELVTCSHYAHA